MSDAPEEWYIDSPIPYEPHWVCRKSDEEHICTVGGDTVGEMLDNAERICKLPELERELEKSKKDLEFMTWSRDTIEADRKQLSSHLANKSDELTDIYERYGICPECKTPWHHDFETPFAYCECGHTSEWTFEDASELPVIMRGDYLHYMRHRALLKLVATLDVYGGGASMMHPRLTKAIAEAREQLNPKTNAESKDIASENSPSPEQ